MVFCACPNGMGATDNCRWCWSVNTGVSAMQFGCIYMEQKKDEKKNATEVAFNEGERVVVIYCSSQTILRRLLER